MPNENLYSLILEFYIKNDHNTRRHPLLGQSSSSHWPSRWTPSGMKPPSHPLSADSDGSALGAGGTPPYCLFNRVPNRRGRRVPYLVGALATQLSIPCQRRA